MVYLAVQVLIGVENFMLGNLAGKWFYREQISVYLLRHPKAGRNTHLKKQPRAGQDTQHV